MPERELRLIAASILAGSGLIALAVVGVGGWHFLSIPVVAVASIFAMLGVIAWFRS
jgi:hypothetical protein